MPDMSGFSTKILNELDAAAAQSEQSGGNGGSRWLSGFQNAVSVALGNIMSNIGMQLGQYFVNGLSGGIERLDTMAVFPKIMENMGISAEDSENAIQRVSTAIIGLPTALDDAARSVQRLTMSTGDIDRATDVFIAFNNALISGGAPVQLQASALEQFTQAVNKGKPDMLEWRTLMNAMPAQLSQIAASMGMTAAELGTGLRNGEISMDDFLDAIVRLNDEGVNGFGSFSEQVESMTGTVQVALKNAQNRVEKFWQEIFEGVGQEKIADFINGLTEKLPELGEKIGGVVSEVIDFFERCGQEIDELGLDDTIDEIGEHIDDLAAKFSLDGTAFTSIDAWAHAVFVVFNNFVLVPLNDIAVAVDSLITSLQLLGQFFRGKNPVDSTYYTDVSGMGAAGTPTGPNAGMDQNFFREYEDSLRHLDEVNTNTTESMTNAWNTFSEGFRFETNNSASVFGLSMGTIRLASDNAVSGIEKGFGQFNAFADGVFSSVSASGSASMKSVESSFGTAKATADTVFAGIEKNITASMQRSTSAVGTEVGKINSKLSSIKTSIGVNVNVYKTGINKIGVDGSLAGGGLSVWTAAAGGIATRPTFGLWGEAGDEALIPLSNREKVRPFAQAVAAEMGAGTVNNYYIDGNMVAADAALAAALDTVAQRVGGRRRMGVVNG